MKKSMKFLKGISCCNAGSTQTIDAFSSSVDREGKASNNEKPLVNWKQDSRTIVDDSEKSTIGIDTSYSINADLEDFCDFSSSGIATPSSVDAATVATIFRSTPKSSQELMAQNSFQVATPTGSMAHLENWGYPGHLSKEEYEVYVKFYNEVAQRSTSFQQTIFSFGTEETEDHALCRWLRARKFDLKKVIQMVEEATEFRAEAAKEDFFPDGSKALGVEKSIYYALYPELFIGYTKHGYPFYITKAGKADLKAILCITSMKNLVKFHWHCMAHALCGQMRRRAMTDKSFKRFEACSIVDLEGLSIMNAMEALNVLKEFTAIDQLCFPETLHRFIFINSPPAFSAVWRIIRNLIDYRTANKVEILAKKSVWKSRLLDLVGASSLPSDYGGTFTPLTEIFEKHTKDRDVLRQITYPISLHSSWSVVTHTLLLEHDYEVMELSVLTRSLKTGTFTVIERRRTEDVVVQVIDVKHSVAPPGEYGDEQPTRVTFPQLLHGPGEFQVQVNCMEGQGTFVLVGKAYVRNSDSRRQGPLLATMVKSGERRYSNFDLTPLIESDCLLEECKPEVVIPSSINDQKQYSSRLLSTLKVALIFFLFIVIHDFLLVWIVSNWEDLWKLSKNTCPNSAKFPVSEF